MVVLHELNYNNNMEKYFFAVINDENQFSYWEGEGIPKGWKSVQSFYTKEECIAFIEREWKDIRPKSLIKKIAKIGNQTIQSFSDCLEKHELMKEVYTKRYLHDMDSWSNYDYLKDCVNLFFTKYASVLSQKSVFEIGIGSGISSEFILKNGFKLTGIDVVEHKNWKKLKEFYGESFRPMVEDILLFNPQKENYDIVLDNGCFHHFEPELYLRTFNKVQDLLVDNGYFYLAVFEEPKEDLVQGHIEYLDGGKRRCKFFTETEISNLLSANNFELLATERVTRNFDNVKTLLCIAKKKIK